VWVCVGVWVWVWVSVRACLSHILQRCTPRGLRSDQIRSLTEASDTSIFFLKDQVEEYKLAEERMRIRKDGDIAKIQVAQRNRAVRADCGWRLSRRTHLCARCIQASHKSKVDSMSAVISTLQKESHQRQQWILTLQEEAEEASATIKEWQRKYDALGRVKSDEVRGVCVCSYRLC